MKRLSPWTKGKSPQSQGARGESLASSLFDPIACEVRVLAGPDFLRRTS